MFNHVSHDFIQKLKSNNIEFDGYCAFEAGFSNGIKKINIEEAVKMQDYNEIKILVPYDHNYVKQVRYLAECGIKES